MAATQHDYSEHLDSPDDDVLAQISAKVSALKKAQVSADELQVKLTAAQERVRALEEQDIPELMERVKLKELKTQDGTPLQIVEKLRTSIPKANEEETFKWLENNNHGALVKRTVVIKFGRDEEKWADKFQRDCARRKKPLNLDRNKKVEPSTLKKFVKDSLEAGVDLPSELFSVFRQRVAKIG